MSWPNRTLLISILGTVPLIGCMPPAEGADAPVQEPEPVDSNGIPWAPGEAPEDAASTTRQAPEGPKEREERPDSFYQDDGIQQTSPGSSKCSGKAPPSLRAAVDVRANETHECYDKVPVEQAGAQGDIKISLKVGKTGKVQEVNVLSDSLGVPAVTSCVQEVLHAPFTDTPPRGGCAVFVVPIHLQSEKVEPTE